MDEHIHPPAAPRKVEEGALRDHCTLEPAPRKSVLSDQVIRVSDPAGTELRTSDYGPLARGQRNLQVRYKILGSQRVTRAVRNQKFVGEQYMCKAE